MAFEETLAPRAFWPGFVLRLAFLLCGPLALAVIGGIEAWLSEQQPWAEAVIVSSGEPPWEGMMPVLFHRLPKENFPDSFLMSVLRQNAGGQELIELFHLDEHEVLIALDVPSEQWQRLLESGRAPVPGSREVAAGDLCRLDTFTMDGETFTVVGRLRRGVSGMTFAYAVPDHGAIRPHFAEEAGGKTAWLDPHGLRRFNAANKSRLLDQMAIWGGTRSRAGFAEMAILGLVLTAAAGITVWFYCFRSLARRIPGVLGAVFREMEQYRTLLVALHVGLYAVLFASMFLALVFPLAQLRVALFTTTTFEEGALDFVGKAYKERDILRAAGITWFWNFWVQTLFLCVIPSLLIPFIGAIKNLLSLGLAGFALAPTWVGSAARMVYHSGTMVLEIEGYILATFLVILYPVHVVTGLIRSRFGEYWKRTSAMLLSGTVVSGVILALAALYEAVTLILLG